VAPDFSGRLSAYVTRLEQEFGVYVPGRSRRAAAAEAREHGITIPRDLFERLSR
jgi:LDH2 family malate/lactate/ureidoglycolate dehydrogenase